MAILKNSYCRVSLSVGTGVFEADVADSIWKRITGLSGREPKENGNKMFFIFPDKARRIFWMRGMKFSIDIIWISGDEIIGIEESVPVESGFSLKKYSSPSAVDRVLELPAGYCKQYKISIGDKIIIN